MILDLRRLFLHEGESISVRDVFDFSDVELFGHAPLKQLVEAAGTIENRAGVVELRFRCWVTYEAPCDRCAADAVEILEIPVEKILVTERQNEDDDELVLLEDYKLDLQDLCYHEIIPNLPTKHLCKKDCKGVCPTCGKNLNEGACDCATKTVDPRLAKLRDLLDE